MKIIDYSKDRKNLLDSIMQRRMEYSEDFLTGVKKTIEEVRSKGDGALRDFTIKYDKVKIDEFRVTQAEINEALRKTPAALLQSFKKARAIIQAFHRSTLLLGKPVETVSGVNVWREWRAIEKVGLYIPGGKASYPSTVLMLGIPAKLAGCKRIVLCSPPNQEGKISDVILAACDIVGISEIYKVGGAQAIAALAYGTQSIPKIDKIFGPGNSYVTAAKLLIYPDADIDMPAGPTEIFIIADQSANPRFIAADFLSQLEHGQDSQAILVTTSTVLAKAVQKEISAQVKNLERKNIIDESLKKSFIILTRSLDEAASIANDYAPEHLEIITKNPSGVLKKIMNVGSVFLGEFSPESAGDYATGANHTLPTSGFAKTFSPISVESFGKKIQVQKLTEKGLLNIKNIAGEIASAEGLGAHKKAIDIRFE